MTNNHKKTKKRILAMLFVVAGCFTLLAGKLGYLMIVNGDELKKQAMEDQSRDRLINAKRGTIYDRNGKVLAISASVETVSISPVTVRKDGDPEKTAKLLAETLELDEAKMLEKINKNTSYEIIKRKVEKEQADIIREAELAGVYLDEDSKRYYPLGNSAAHVIGFTGTDNQGLLGIEMVYDSVLKGKPGRVVTSKKADGTEMPYKQERYYTPENGTDIVLTIDQTLQHFLEKHLDTAVVENKLQQGAAGMIMDVKTGELLAMSTKPDFDLNDPFTLNDEAEKQRIETIADKEEREKEYKAATEKMWRNKAVQDNYEAGSTFKIFVSAMALEEKLVTLNDTFFCSGVKNVGGWPIHCWRRQGHGSQTFVEALQNSCNPAFMTIGERIGNDLFKKYYEGFGFTSKTGIELPGETAGVFYQKGMFNEVELATSSFGQGPVVTPLQMITAAAAVANDGYLMKPHLVKQFNDENGTPTQVVEPTVVRQIISPETSKQLRELLEKVVSEGSGNRAFLQGYHVAGKTGTSEKLPRGHQKYVSSFIGFAPANDPKIAVLIALDEATGGDTYGGVIAAPVVKKIMEDSLRYLGVEPDLTEEEAAQAEVATPDVVNKSLDEARGIMTTFKLNVKVEGSGDTVLEQVPKGGVKVAENSTVILYTEKRVIPKTMKVPDVTGLTYKEAEQKLSEYGLKISVSGDTENKVAVKQSPAKDEMITPGGTVTVTFEKKAH